VSNLTWGKSPFKIKETAGSKNPTQALGGEWRGYAGLAPSPVCQSKRRADQRGLSSRAEGGTLLAFCLKHSCDFCDVEKVTGLPRNTMHVDPNAVREADIKREAFAAEQLANVRRRWGTKGDGKALGSILCEPAMLNSRRTL
jgi:hypothetical protein